MKIRHMNKIVSHLVKFSACAILLVLSASSCEKEGNETRVARELELTPAEEELVRQGNAVAFELFKHASATLGTNDNIMLSPVSLNTALAMTANGADGATKEAIYKATGLEGTDEQQTMPITKS